MMTLEQKEQIRRLAVVLTLLVPFAFVAFPYFWMTLCSFSSEKDLFSDRIIPLSLTISHYQELFDRTPFITQFKNSVIVAVLATIICLAVSTLAGYSLSRYRHRWSFEKVMLIIKSNSS